MGGRLEDRMSRHPCHFRMSETPVSSPRHRAAGDCIARTPLSLSISILALSCEGGDTPSISAARLHDRPAARQMRNMSAYFRYLRASATGVLQRPPSALRPLHLRSCMERTAVMHASRAEKSRRRQECQELTSKT